MKKKLTAFVITLCLLVSAFNVMIPAVTVASDYIPNILEYSSYTGSSNYVITSYNGMVAFSDLADTTDFSGKTVYLGSDIDMSPGLYTPFSYFAGTFDGQGYALKNINISESDISTGVFTKVAEEGTVKNLGVEGGTMKLSSSSDSYRLGSIAGVLYGTIERCYSTATLTISASGSTTDLSVGGIAGGSLNGGLIKNCYFAGTIYGVAHASGICDWGQGHNSGAVGQIENCYSIGKLYSNDNYGLTRYSNSTLSSNYAAAVKNCYYLSEYNGVSFSSEDKTISDYMLGSGYLAYLLDSGASSSRTRVWHQGELFPELSGDKAIGTYKITVKHTSPYSSSSSVVYKNAGDKISVDYVTATLSSSGNVTDNVFTTPASAATLEVTTGVPNIVDYNSNSTSNSYIVSTAAGFTKLATLVNAGTDTFSGDKIYMLNDVDMSTVSHTPIGVYISTSDRSTSFQGTFYGNNNDIIALNVNKTSLDGGGLFGAAYNAKFYGLGISYGTVTTANRAGGIAGYADACEFHECYNAADITTTSGEDGAGGLAGVSRNTTKYYNCFNIGTVTADSDCAGGITGWGQSNVVLTNCFNMGDVNASDAEGLTRYEGSLTTTPVASYYLSDACSSGYGESKSRSEFATGNVAWLLNTSGGTDTNSYKFTNTPLCPALCDENSQPTVKVTINGVDEDGSVSSTTVTYCNSGDCVAPIAGSKLSFANSGSIAPRADGVVEVTMSTTNLGTVNIGTAAALQNFAAGVNNGNSYSGYTVKLTADIDMSGYSCVPIGTESKPFSGVFDGQGHSVKNYNISGNARYNAMFGVVSGGTIMNVQLENSTIEGGYFTGALVGKNAGGTIMNCGTNANVNVSYTAAKNTLSVMSFNVRVNSDSYPNSVSDRASRVKQHINSYSPDIIGFQEVIPLWRTNFNSFLSNYSCEFTWRDYNYNEAAPLYWKTSKFTVLEQDTFWLSTTPDTMSLGWGATYYRTCSYAVLLHKETGILVIAMNTHFDHQSTSARDNSALLIISRMKALEAKYSSQGYGDNIAAFCTGDYNCTNTSSAYKNMTSYLSDLRVDAKTKYSSESQITYHGWGNSSKLIDFIFTNKKGCQSLTYKVNNELINGYYISDHYALYGTLGLNYMHAGGLVGYNSGLITDCYTTGTLTGGMNTGGLVGYNTGTVQNCFNGSAVKSNAYMSGFVGVNKGTCTNCYYLVNSAYTDPAANASTAAVMQSENFANKLNAGGDKWRYNSGLNKGFPFPYPLFISQTLMIKETSSYSVNDSDFLLSVTQKTTVASLTSNFENSGLTIRDTSGNVVGSTSTVGTGYTVNIEYSGTVIDSVIIVVAGDLNGDSIISTTDYMICNPCISGQTQLNDLMFTAADVNGDRLVSSSDILAIEKYISE